MPQPPSGGCVLKLTHLTSYQDYDLAATFGWLCVETVATPSTVKPCCWQPPSGGCVLKHHLNSFINVCNVAATFGWLCVETIKSFDNL